MTAVTWLAADDAWRTRGRSPIPHQLGDGAGAPQPPSPAPASWQAAVAAQDITQAVLWYEAHTGYGGINPDNPTDLPLTAAELTGDGSGIDTEYDGQVIEGKVAARIRIRHNNVTVRRCHILSNVSTLYSIQWHPMYSATFTGATVEFCTIESPTDGHAAPAMMRGQLTEQLAMTFRHNNIVNTTTGGRFEHHILSEYNYFHDFQHPDGGHASGTRFMGDRGTARRNLITDASSSLLGMYLDQGGMNHVTYEENILGGTIHMPDGRVISPGSSPSYAHSIGMGDLVLEPKGLRLLNNLYYGGYQYGLIAGNVPWGVDGNVRRGNRALQDFVIQPDSVPNRQEYTAGQLLPFNDE